MQITLYDTVKRPWGYETLAMAVDDVGKVYNFTVDTDKKDADIAAQAVAVVADIVAREAEITESGTIDTPAPTPELAVANIKNDLAHLVEAKIITSETAKQIELLLASAAETAKVK